MLRQFLTTSALIAVSASSALAGEIAPWLSGEVIVEWQNEYRSDSDDATIDDTNNSFLRTEVAPTIRLSDSVYIDGVLVLEPFDQAATLNERDDIWFDREGIFAEELKINFEVGAATFFAGKFNPAFGTAWDFGRGIWSEDFAEDYEITEKLGVGASYAFETANAGTHTLYGATFFSDTSFLSEGIITSRDHVNLEDGGASNTEDFSSFSLALDGENAFGIENFGYHLAGRFLGEQDKNRDATTDDETGFVAALTYLAPVNDNLSFDLLGEVVTLSNSGGVRDADVNYYTGSVVTRFYQDWNVTAGYTNRDFDNDGSGASFDDHLFQLSGGYDFGNGLTAEAGWRNSEEACVDTDILGFLFRYTRGF